MRAALFATAHFGTTDVILVVVIVVLLVGSALLALAETALSRTSKAKALALRDEHRRGSGRLVRLVENPQAFLNPILLLVLICQLVTATLVGILAERFFGALGVLAATFFEVVVIFVLAEALPKNWAVYNPERSSLFVAPVISALVGFPPCGSCPRASTAWPISSCGRATERRGACGSPSCWPWPTWPWRKRSSRPKSAS